MPTPKGEWTGEKNPKWKGGRRMAQGYVFILRPDHPNANKSGYVREHVLVMADHIGRPITRQEIVHHKNAIRNDNRLDNLELMTRSHHHSLHHKGVVKPNSIKNLQQTAPETMTRIWATSRAHQRRPKTCDHCGREFYGGRAKKNARVFCSRQCYGRANTLKALTPSLRE